MMKNAYRVCPLIKLLAHVKTRVKYCLKLKRKLLRSLTNYIQSIAINYINSNLYIYSLIEVMLKAKGLQNLPVLLSI